MHYTYTLYSKGRLLSGANEVRVLRAVSHITRVDTDKTRTLYLSGRRTTIRRIGDRELSHKLAHHLEQIGLDVEVIKEDEEIIAPLPPSTLVTYQPEQKRAPSRPGIYVMLGLITIALTCGCYLFIA